MTYEQYWYADPLMVRAFRKADKLRQEQIDTEAWLHGVYLKKAIEATVGNVFLKKGKNPIEYPDCPILLEEKRRKDEELRQTDEQQTAYARLYMMKMMEAGRNWGKESN